MEISTRTRKTILYILKRLVFSETKEEYEEFYSKLEETAPDSVMNYYNKFWHDIRHEWVLYWVYEEGSFNNHTNNRAEGTHAKIKEIIDNHSTLVQFGKDFFIFLKSQQNSVRSKSAQSMTKRPTAIMSSDAQKYCDFLTAKAFSNIQPELESYKFIDIVGNNRETKTCYFRYQERILAATLTKCECVKKSMSLPCRHIFSTRQFYNEPIFDKQLCSKRWTKEYNLYADKVLFNINQKVTHFSSKNVSKISRKDAETKEELERKYNALYSAIVNVGSISTGLAFERKIFELKTVMEIWSNKKEVEITKKLENKLNQSTQVVQNSTDLFGRRRKLLALKQKSCAIELSRRKIKTLENLMIFWNNNHHVEVRETSETENDSTLNDSTLNNSAVNSISEIKEPISIKIRGQPKQVFKTYIKYYFFTFLCVNYTQCINCYKRCNMCTAINIVML